jgi:hypothetical protein
MIKGCEVNTGGEGRGEEFMYWAENEGNDIGDGGESPRGDGW